MDGKFAAMNIILYTRKKGNVNHTNIDIRAMLVWLTLPFYDFFVVFDPSLLTMCINCIFYIYSL